jgi:hypothetical protein
MVAGLEVKCREVEAPLTNCPPMNTESTPITNYFLLKPGLSLVSV